MALLTVNYRSQSLHRNVQFMVYLPTDDSRIPVQPPYKTYYLLHGMQYDCTAFPIQTSIIRKAREQGIAVVMPSGENSFFTDHDTSSNRFETYVAQELIEATRAMFPLSHKREDTFIGGFSMGGFGAMRIGLKYHETFSRITTFSAAIHFYETDPVDVIFNEDQWIGGKTQTEHTDINPRVLATELARIKQDDPSVNVPAIYMTCGLQDGLLTANQRFYTCLQQLGYDVTFHTYEGVHNWDFVDERLPEVLDWLPL